MAGTPTIRPLNDGDFPPILIPKDNLVFATGFHQIIDPTLDANANDENRLLEAYVDHYNLIAGMDQQIGEADGYRGVAAQDTTTWTVKEMNDSQPQRDYISQDFVYTVGLSYQSLAYLADNAPPASVAPEPPPPGTEPPANGGLPTDPPPGPAPPDPLGGGDGGRAGMDLP